LDIPESVVDKFLNQGMGLRWVRVRFGATEDISNISKRLRDGYVFVKPDEATELVKALGLILSPADERIMNGDLALMKVPVDIQEARHEYYMNQARINEAAHMRDLEKTQNKHVRIQNDSRSHVTRGSGRQAQYKSDE
jgi:hypothetical protein